MRDNQWLLFTTEAAYHYHPELLHTETIMCDGVPAHHKRSLKVKCAQGYHEVPQTNTMAAIALSTESLPLLKCLC